MSNLLSCFEEGHNFATPSAYKWHLILENVMASIFQNDKISTGTNILKYITGPIFFLNIHLKMKEEHD